jgi:hypothetical protein
MKIIDRKYGHGKHGILMFIVLIYILLSTLPLSAQQERSDIPAFKDRLFYGGSMGLQFGSITDIQLSPVIGLWVLPRLSIAVGPDYRFYKDSYGRTYNLWRKCLYSNCCYPGSQ